MNVDVEGVCWGPDKIKEIIRNVEMHIATGEFVGVIGPNGSGKSTLLRTIYRVLRPCAGLITLDGENVWAFRPHEMAQRAAVVLQETPAEFDFKVYEIVMMGRSPHKKIFDRESEEDRCSVADALRRVGLSDCADRSFHTLSGGEKQRVLVARALAQQAQLLILDEPTNHLDIRYQLEILELVKDLGVTAIAALHDLTLAALYCTHIYVLFEGRVVAFGKPEEILTSDLIYRVYGVCSEVWTHPRTGQVQVSFFPDRLNLSREMGKGGSNV